MNPIDTFFGGGKQAASQQREQGYNQANQYMDPYYQGGLEDYNTYRGDINKMGQQLDQYGNPADYQWRNAGLSPNDLYNQWMGDYTESPQAQYEQQAAMQAANNGASASGMMGSGAYFKALQQNSADISARDQQRYFDNMMGTANMQGNWINNFQGQQGEYRRGRAGLAGYGFDAGREMGRNAIGAANERGNAEEGAADGWSKAAGAAASFFF